MAHPRQHFEFDLGQGDKVIIGDLILTVHDITADETSLLVEDIGDSDCEVGSPLAEVVCD